MKSVNSKIGYFYTIDLFRGFAAIFILVWHYHHFYLEEPFFLYPGHSPIWVFEIQPFYDYLKLFYHYGGWLVRFFWIISGFVFAYVYINRKTTLRNFAIHRFSRLYPLHLITLLIIGGLQLINVLLLGHPQIIGVNDTYHFILNLFFASSWGFQYQYSFNSPIWSVSVEIIIYFFFFSVLKHLNKRIITLSFLFVLSFFLLKPLYAYFIDAYSSQILACGFYFFSGVLLYSLIKYYKEEPRNILFFGAFLTILTVLVYEVHLLLPAKLIAYAFNGFIVLLFSTILSFVAWFDVKGYSFKFKFVFQWIGNSTYSIYLWHLPIQVFILFIFEYFNLNREIFNSESIFIGWIILMLIVGRMSYLLIEKPLQNKIRERLEKKDKK